MGKSLQTLVEKSLQKLAEKVGEKIGGKGEGCKRKIRN